MDNVQDVKKKDIVKARVDSDLKEKAEKELNSLGLNMATAINMFLSQVVIHHGLPFSVTNRDDRMLLIEKIASDRLAESGSDAIFNKETAEYFVTEEFKDAGLLPEDGVTIRKGHVHEDFTKWKNS
ncbi:type II toxin-antitoxin system RelB/DinJ family antitoxin [Weissella confusa]|uniref:Type II toxin-antitoxin system RelB/DinJ family antitoxin n=1 Tax=Weissella confusa TaxID=1583 RepID=A0AAJ3DB44_WEICO|nr:type II toxin-antitoxin system RelB/DinJ family antitoxin [Weissella confusa]NBA11325.1 type II toxin-antitoxin system RelB/DinJ family antitoxin [Weissella confusa]